MGGVRFEHRYTYRKAVNIIMLSTTGLLTLLALIPLFWVTGYVIVKGGRYLDLDFFTRLPAPLGQPGGGVLHAIEGSILIVALATLFSAPAGVLIGYYAARHPNTPLGMGVRFATDVLSGVPSIVVGLFVYGVVVVRLHTFSVLAGGVALAIIMLPTVIRSTEEMVKLVPPSLREAALALGAPEWRTAISVVLPAALEGIVTGVILGVARAAGETAPLLFTTLGNDNFEVIRLAKLAIGVGASPWEIARLILTQPVDALPLTLWKYSQQPYPERVNQAWAIALVLMMLVLGLNLMARVWLAYRRRR
ncbi:MAG: phosphate ABC transporter permease PtsA [Chloroflexi bacterium]|nr:MAG: phosphate ABC transporter permease PtsA [Chloroflexota bacterium]HDN79947.1 phosphate ABC transporter permease PstA [Chloroflexota bacterium]